MIYVSYLVQLGILLSCMTPLMSQDTLIIDGTNYHIDTNKRLIVVNQAINSDSQFIGIALLEYYTFDSNYDSLTIGTPYIIKDQDDIQYTLYFTQLPIVTIEPSEDILDEPRTLAQFTLTEHDGTQTISPIGIEYRGGYSQSYDKKSMRIEFWDDATGADTRNVSLLGMRSDDDWNLQAMYNEPMRLRSKSAFDLWREIDTLYYLDDEPEAINGVHYQYVEVFINGNFRGVYGLSERVDRKQLRLKKEDDGIIRGELYKGIWWDEGVLLRGAPNYDNSSTTWSGYEYEYPENIDWSNLHDFTSYVVEEEEEEFLNTISERFDMDNLVNYFIFLNLTRAEDNTGKNIYLARYDNDQPYFYVPWDLDGIFGMRWDGIRWRITDDILSNGLYDRLLEDTSEDGFIDKLKKRWSSLREEIITVEHINQILNQNYTLLHNNGVYERERMAWPNTELLDENTETYTTGWIIERIAFLDEAFENFDVVSSNEEIDTEIKWDTSPNPTTGIISIRSEQNIRQVLLYSNDGTIVQRISDHHITEIDMTTLPEGIYFVKAIDESGQIGINRVIYIR